MGVWRRRAVGENVARLRAAGGCLQLAVETMLPRVTGADAAKLRTARDEAIGHLGDAWRELGWTGVGEAGRRAGPLLPVDPPAGGVPAPEALLRRFLLATCRVLLAAAHDPKRTRGERQRLRWVAARVRDATHRLCRFARYRLAIDPRQMLFAGEHAGVEVHPDGTTSPFVEPAALPPEGPGAA